MGLLTPAHFRRRRGEEPSSAHVATPQQNPLDEQLRNPGAPKESR